VHLPSERARRRMPRGRMRSHGACARLLHRVEASASRPVSTHQHNRLPRACWPLARGAGALQACKGARGAAARAPGRRQAVPAHRRHGAETALHLRRATLPPPISGVAARVRSAAQAPGGPPPALRHLAPPLPTSVVLPHERGRLRRRLAALPRQGAGGGAARAG